jgi:hypothetical protein
MTKFSELLEEYLDERDRQNSDYYDDRYIGSKTHGRELMQELAEAIDKLIHGVEE